MLDEPVSAFPRTPELIDHRPTRRIIPLDGVLERHQYPPMLMAIGVLVLVFVLFQAIISPLVIVIGLLARGMSLSELVEALGTLIPDQLNLVLVANTIGQVLGLAVPAILVARMHSSDWRQFLRIRPSTWLAVLLGIIGLFALTPTVQWLAAINQGMPLPQFLRRLEDAQNDLIEQVLLHGQNVWFTLLALAITPAICEELLFRGYVLRQAERGLGVVGGILFTGIAFGCYHLRPTQLLPLSVLGLYLAFLCWSTGSLLPAVIAHFTNNAAQVLISAYAQARPGTHSNPLEDYNVPWYSVVIGLVILAPIVIWLSRGREPVEAGASPEDPREVNLPIE